MRNKQQLLSNERLKELDAMYEATEERGTLGKCHTQFGPLVEALRAIRRLVEAGVDVKIEGTQTVLNRWENFYAWAHGRYPGLEEGADHWIGDDIS